MKRPYIFYLTSYDRSNGIRVMMLLAQRLASLGFTVHYYLQDKNNWEKTGLPLLERITEELRREAVVVYPEIVAGNPLQIRNVARFVLFYPGRNGGMRHYHKSEMTFAYRPEFLPGANVLTVPWIDHELFSNPGKARTEDLCFVYKGGRWCDPPELRNLRTITMTWPPSREKLAELLKHTRTLYSFDDASALLDEACCCGVAVKIVRQNGFSDYHSDHDKIEREFSSQLENFISVTQSSDYKGRLQSRFLFAYWTYAVWRYWIKPLLSKTN